MTGSQNLSMLKSVSESMAGRVGIITLHNMTLYEEYDLAGKPTWIHRYLEDPTNLKSYFAGTIATGSLFGKVWRGSLPGTLSLPNDTLPLYFSSYVKTYIDRDVRLTAEVQDIRSFTDFVGMQKSTLSSHLIINCTP